MDKEELSVTAVFTYTIIHADIFTGPYTYSIQMCLWLRNGAMLFSGMRSVQVKPGHVMKCLVNTGVILIDIYIKFQAQHSDETLSRSITSEWCKHFKGGHMSVNDDPGRCAVMHTTVFPQKSRFDLITLCAPCILNLKSFQGFNMSNTDLLWLKMD